MNTEQHVFDLLFETSWEVCNKVGGIYTVLSTKANTLQTICKDKVIFVGPDLSAAENMPADFLPSGTLLSGWRKKADLPQGITVRIGRWNIPGQPIAVLVKFDSLYKYKNELYGRMWQAFGVDSLHAYGDYDEACAFSAAAAAVIESIVRYKGFDKTDKNGLPLKKVIAHFDEWTTGMGLLMLRLSMPTVASVFTTHATSIGRSICSNGKPLYDYLNAYNGDQMAAELNMQSKHSLEKAAAHNADAFTTVSNITAAECTQLLERTPAPVTPNGFEPDFVPAGKNFDNSRRIARHRLLRVASALTGQPFDDSTFILATSGRCEFRNKGIDVFLDSMARLASQKHSDRILAFVMVPSWVAGPRADLAMAMQAENTGGPLPLPYITHNLHNEDSDQIVATIRRLGLDKTNDKLTVIFAPCYLNGNDGIFNMPYYDLLIGMDATAFPSYYEPWGYTTLESIAFGVPTITTSLSGFGSWILQSYPNSIADCGVKVIDRNDSNYWQVCEQLAETVNTLIAANPDERIAAGNAAMFTAKAALWSNFIKYYIDAYQNAFDAAITRNRNKNC